LRIEKMQFKIFHGWYCSECDAIYFNPDDDTEHEDIQISVDFIEYDKLKEWINDAQDFGLSADEILKAIQNFFRVE
jgi:hypothetical protein